jgi:electron transfer flavoprotein beta subunit
VKLVVLVKVAATVDEEFELDENRVDADSLEWELNEWDAYSVEEAVRIRDLAGDETSEVVVVTVGGEEAEDGLLNCLAKGADRAVWIRDESPAPDVLVVARMLAAVVERESPKLVLSGVQSSDAANGATGVAVSGYLGLPRVAVVRKVDYQPGADNLTVERELEGGLVEALRVSLPALLTVQSGINEPRYATFRAIKQARDKPMEVLDPSDLGLSEDQLADAAGSQTLELALPERTEGAEMLPGSPQAVAERITNILQECLGR